MNQVFLLDFDECLAPVNQSAGVENIKKLLKQKLGKRKGSLIGNSFGQMFRDINAILHAKTNARLIALKKRLNSYRIQIPRGLTGEAANFMWSRELWLKYLSDENNLDFDGRTITRLADAYWNGYSRASPMYPQAVEYLSRADNRRLFLILGSDRRLLFENGTMVYDPMISEKKKIVRIQKQGLGKLLPENHIITGDPYDKPSQEFWQKVMQRTGLAQTSQGIVVDDSLPTVLSAIKFGFNGYLPDRKDFYGRNDVEHKVDGYITELDQLPV